MLTAAQLTAREGKLTASAVGCLMTGNAEKIMRLWQELVGDPDLLRDDLSAVWPVRLGEASEAVNIEWWERTTGRTLTRRGEVVVHPKYEWACCTLDGFDDGLVGPVDAKHVGGFEPRAVVVERYTPQMVFQMDCTGTKTSALSIIEGAKEPVAEAVTWNADYSAELWRRAEAFMQCVWTLTPPVALSPVAAPVVAARIYDFTGKNEWASEAVTWLENAPAKKKAEAAEKSLKSLVPADAAKCHGHGISITRNKAGALSLRAGGVA